MASKSTQIETDLLSVINNDIAAPGASGYLATLALCNAPSGHIMDYMGNLQGCLLKAQSIWARLTQLKKGTDSTDSTNLGLINGLLAVLAGTGGPSTQVVTDVASLVTNGPTAADLVDVNAPAGPIMNWSNNASLSQLAVTELKSIVTQVVNNTAAGDVANLALLQGVLLVLV